MARISPFFKSAIKRGKIELAPNQGTIEALHRRQLVEWRIYTFVGGTRSVQYATIKATVERLNHRIGMGLALDSSMAEVARPQTDRGKAVVEAWLKRREAEAAKKQTTLKQALSKPAPTAAQAQTAAQVQPVQTASKPATLPKPPKPPTKPKKAAAAKKAATKVTQAAQTKAAPVAPAASAPKKASPVAAPVEEPHIILCFDESGSMFSHVTELAAQSNAIVNRLKAVLPKASVEICRFDSNVTWASSVQVDRLGNMRHTPGGNTQLNQALFEAANKAELMSQKDRKSTRLNSSH